MSRKKTTRKITLADDKIELPDRIFAFVDPPGIDAKQAVRFRTTEPDPDTLLKRVNMVFDKDEEVFVDPPPGKTLVAVYGVYQLVKRCTVTRKVDTVLEYADAAAGKEPK